MGMVRHDYRAVVEARAVLMAIAARHLCNGKPVSAKGLFWRSSKLSANGVGEGMWCNRLLSGPHTALLRCKQILSNILLFPFNTTKSWEWCRHLLWAM